LTDLYNHDYFQEALRREIKWGKAKEDRHLALLMIELDSPKRYNDVYDRRQGDIALLSLARALEACVEQWLGTVARYGGDEFVILPGLDRSGALRAAHEVRDGVRELTAAELSRHGLPGVTVSVGVAVFPADAKDAAQLIEAADRAMYVAKRRAGDQVETFSHIGDSSSFPSRPLVTAREREGKR